VTNGTIKHRRAVIHSQKLQGKDGLRQGRQAFGQTDEFAMDTPAHKRSIGIDV